LQKFTTSTFHQSGSVKPPTVATTPGRVEISRKTEEDRMMGIAAKKPSLMA
jgi:hypothetical protein